MKDWYSKKSTEDDPNKTECILFATPKFNKRTETFKLTIGNMVKHLEDKVKNLRVIFAIRLPSIVTSNH